MFPFVFSALPTTKADLEDDGTFLIEVDLPEQTFRMEGEFDGTSAEGNLSWQYNADRSGIGPVADPFYECDTGPTGWSVSR